MKLKTFDRGIHPAYHKELTSSRAIEAAPLPSTVFIPLRQHAGAQCVPLVKKGDRVEEGQKIGASEAFISAPVHSSISGRVKDIDMMPHPAGGRALSVIIEGDGAIKDWGDGTGAADLGAEEIRSSVREAGVVGLGGAAFPSSVKLSPPDGKAIDTALINACECEPYLTADHRLLVEDAQRVTDGLKLIMKATGAPDGAVCIEDNKTEAIEALKKAAPDIKIIVLKTKYPQGAEKMLIEAALKRTVKAGKLPQDVGVVVNNAGTAAAIHDALVLKKPLIERVITVSGSGVKEPKNLRVRIGTPFNDVISYCGGLTGEGEIEVLNGGPMMGVAQATLEVPVVKGTSGITALFAAKVKPDKYSPCIRCANCVAACPMALMPYRISDYGRTGMTAEFREWSGPSCIECGCCSYVCPSKRPLLQWIRVGKAAARTLEQGR